RHSDTPSAGELVYSFLRDSFDITVFKDTASIAPGEPITEAVKENLVRAKLLVLIIGPRWYDIPEGHVQARIFLPSDWVRWEIKTALKLKIPIVPLYVDGARELVPQNLPPDVKKIAKNKPDDQSAAPRSVRIDPAKQQRDLKDLVNS